MDAHNTGLLSLPKESFLEILLHLPTFSVVQLASLNKQFSSEFSIPNGYYQHLVAKIHDRSINELHQLQSSSTTVSWKKEYRIVSYYNNEWIGSNVIKPVTESTSDDFEQVAQNHIRLLQHMVFQSQRPLYPLPIVNFNIAYFEVHLIVKDRPEPISIGLALEDTLVVGGTKNSFAYSSGWVNCILLETGTCPDVPLPKFSSGDVIGCGIDFAKKSVFFTHNGQLVAEHTKNYWDEELLNLKALNASIETHGSCELKVNFGATPFLFDISKFQPKQPITQLYSSLLKSHILCFPEAETLQKLNEVHTPAHYLPYIPFSHNLLKTFNDFELAMLNYSFQADYVPPMNHVQYLANNLPIMEKWPDDNQLTRIVNQLGMPDNGLSAKQKIDLIRQWVSNSELPATLNLIDHYKEQLWHTVSKTTSLGCSFTFEHEYVEEPYVVRFVPTEEKVLWSAISLAILLYFEEGNANAFWKERFAKFITAFVHLEPSEVVTLATVRLFMQKMQHYLLKEAILRKNSLKYHELNFNTGLHRAMRVYMDDDLKEDVIKFWPAIPRDESAKHNNMWRHIVPLTVISVHHGSYYIQPHFYIFALLHGLLMLNLNQEKEPDFIGKVHLDLSDKVTATELIQIIENQLANQAEWRKLRNLYKFDASKSDEEFGKFLENEIKLLATSKTPKYRLLRIGTIAGVALALGFGLRWLYRKYSK